MKRFKIDLWSSSAYSPFALYVARPCWHRWLTGLTWWDAIDRFDTRDKAMAHYDLIKDLPEYLD